MTESDARAILLLRAFEDAGAPAWSQADAAAAGDAARQSGGEAATFADWIVARAQWGVRRLAGRDATVGTVIDAAGWPAGLASIVVLLALAVGVASDIVGGTHRINVLAPPLLALLLWNLVVYAALGVHALARSKPANAGGPFRAALVRLLVRLGAAVNVGPDRTTASALAAFARDWASRARALYASRSALVLHVAAAAFALGALGSLYGRGLVLEYRAGWDSTFLTPENVHAILAAVLGPAASISGIAVPDVARLASMRFAAGPGEPAALWIHLYAITLVLVVIVPRAVLACTAAWQARRLAAQFPLDLDDAYFQRLRRGWSGAAVDVRVLPYSYRLAPAQRDALRPALERQLGTCVEPDVSEPLPLGAEDELAQWLGAAPAAVVPATTLTALLFAATATPEREHHGAVIRALAAQVGRERMIVLVDESGFRRRFDGADLAFRVDERRQAWGALLAEEGVEPVFVALGAETKDAAPGAAAPASPTAPAANP